jgi:hypothetical protein
VSTLRHVDGKDYGLFFGSIYALFREEEGCDF